MEIHCGDCGENLGIFPIPENAVIFCGDCGMTRINAICDAPDANNDEADCGE